MCELRPAELGRKWGWEDILKDARMLPDGRQLYIREMKRKPGQLHHRKQEGDKQRGCRGSRNEVMQDLVNHNKDFGLYSKINRKILNVLNEMMT
jgi:hypothetical protein